MKVKILEVETVEWIEALIREGDSNELPSIQEEWRFNFAKQLKKLNYAKAYVLVTIDAPKVIEGCLIFQLKERQIAYMAFLEIAPHNKGNRRKYESVAACLIAFAFKQSYIQAKGDYKGILFFDISEEDQRKTQKLMKNYSKKYGAKIYDSTTMVIMDEEGDNLIKRFLSDFD